jgi:hypothetical protein
MILVVSVVVAQKNDRTETRSLRTIQSHDPGFLIGRPLLMYCWQFSFSLVVSNKNVMARKQSKKFESSFKLFSTFGPCLNIVSGVDDGCGVPRRGSQERWNRDPETRTIQCAHEPGSLIGRTLWMYRWQFAIAVVCAICRRQTQERISSEALLKECSIIFQPCSSRDEHCVWC